MALKLFTLFPAHRLADLASAGSLRAMREGLLWVLPCLLLAAAFLISGELARVLGLPEPLVELLVSLYQHLSATMPLLIAASIGYMLAIRYRLPQVPVAFLCLSQVVIAAHLLADSPRAAATLVLFIAIVLPLVNVPLLAHLHRQRWTWLVRHDLVGFNVKDTINMVIPGLLSAGLLVALLWLMLQLGATAELHVPFDLHSLDSPYLSGMLVSALNSVLWFFGIHGYHAMQPFFAVLDQAVVVNAGLLSHGQPAAYALNSGLLGCFAFIGGSGGTLSLVLAILVFSRSRSLRLLAIAGAPLALLNVNEVLLFGLPIILNPRLCVPFVLVPVLNTLLAVSAVQLGWVAPAVASLPLTSPMLLNAYLSSGGDFAAVALQLGLAGFGTLVYAPFVLALHRRNQGKRSVYLKTFDATFRGLEETGRFHEQDPVTQAYTHAAAQALQLERIRRISQYDFHLEYQPQFSRTTGHCTGCEALIRARDHDGNAHEPWEFLKWLDEAGMMAEVDLWVARQALEQQHRWQQVDFALPITINVTAATLSDEQHSERLLEILAEAGGNISLELTESALVGDVPATHRLIERLHRIGAKLYIDDFGTGYSALSYLHQFKVDVVKIDRSFVVAQRDAHGERLLNGLLRFCEVLELGIVVEGVETREQLDALQSSSELIIQGWYFSPALEGEQLPARVREINQRGLAWAP